MLTAVGDLVVVELVVVEEAVVAVVTVAVMVMAVGSSLCWSSHVTIEDYMSTARCKLLDILCRSTGHLQDRMCRMWGP